MAYSRFTVEDSFLIEETQNGSAGLPQELRSGKKSIEQLESMKLQIN